MPPFLDSTGFTETRLHYAAQVLLPSFGSIHTCCILCRRWVERSLYLIVWHSLLAAVPLSLSRWRVVWSQLLSWLLAVSLGVAVAVAWGTIVAAGVMWVCMRGVVHHGVAVVWRQAVRMVAWRRVVLIWRLPVTIWRWPLRPLSFLITVGISLQTRQQSFRNQSWVLWLRGGDFKGF